MHGLSHQIMSQRLHDELSTFIIASEPLQKSLATLASMTKVESTLRKRLVKILRCSILDVENDCSFLLNGTNKDFGFLTTLRLDDDKRFQQSNTFNDLIKNVTGCQNCHQWTNLPYLTSEVTYVLKVFPRNT